MVRIEVFAVVLIFTIMQASTLEERRHPWLQRNTNGLKRDVFPWHDIDDTLRKSLQHSNDITTKSHALPYDSNIYSDNSATNSRIVKIINANQRGLLAVNKNGEVYATGKVSPEVEFRKFAYSVRNKKYEVKLQNVKYSKYLAISCRTGKVYSTSNMNNLETDLIYSPDATNGDTFQSEKCSQGSATFWFLGIKKDGENVKNAKTASASDRGTRFIVTYS